MAIIRKIHQNQNDRPPDKGTKFTPQNKKKQGNLAQVKNTGLKKIIME